MHPPATPGRALGLLVLAALVLAACSGAGGEQATTTTSRPTTTTEPPPTAPLTGEALTDEDRAAEVLGRPALVVKIDNHDQNARPQTGIAQADVVYEERVEGGATRLAAVFHSEGSDPVGPIRSARTSDIGIVSPLNRPLFAFSGANREALAEVLSAPIVDARWDALPDEYEKVRERPGPHDLYSTTSGLWSHAPDGAGPPPPLFTYRDRDDAPAGGEPVEGVTFAFGGRVNYGAAYSWDSDGWAREQNGTPHLDAAGDRIAPANVIVQFVDYVDTSQRDQAGSAVPEAQLVGSGDAWVLTGGRLLRATWAKPSLDAVTTYTDPAGRPVALAPGRTWVELVPPGQAELVGAGDAAEPAGSGGGGS